MSPRPLFIVCALLSGSLFVASSLRASGSYPPNPPRLGGDALAKIDSVAYNLGKLVFTNRLELPGTPPPNVDPAANRARLSTIQTALPERVGQQVDLPALAERLNAEQIEALVYYLSIRFRIKLPSPGDASA